MISIFFFYGCLFLKQMSLANLQIGGTVTKIATQPKRRTKFAFVYIVFGKVLNTCPSEIYVLQSISRINSRMWLDTRSVHFGGFRIENTTNQQVLSLRSSNNYD